MTMWGSPVDSDGQGMWSGGGQRPWWDFPFTMGPPKQQNVPNACYVEQVSPRGEVFGMPVNCGPMYGPGHVFTGEDEWVTWFGGP